MRAVDRRVLRLRPDTQCQVEDAAAVREDHEASRDPDAAGIPAYGDDLRVDGTDGAPRLVKRLVDGAWTVDSPTRYPYAESDQFTAPRTTCALCGAAARDAALDGWHVFDDPSGDEQVLCRACLGDG